MCGHAQTVLDWHFYASRQAAYTGIQTMSADWRENKKNISNILLTSKTSNWKVWRKDGIEIFLTNNEMLMSISIIVFLNSRPVFVYPSIESDKIMQLLVVKVLWVLPDGYTWHSLISSWLLKVALCLLNSDTECQTASKLRLTMLWYQTDYLVIQLTAFHCSCWVNFNVSFADWQGEMLHSFEPWRSPPWAGDKHKTMKVLYAFQGLTLLHSVPNHSVMLGVQRNAMWNWQLSLLLLLSDLNSKRQRKLCGSGQFCI